MMRTTKEDRDCILEQSTDPNFPQNVHEQFVSDLAHDADVSLKLLHEALAALQHHKASLLEYCPSCRQLARNIADYLGEEP